MPDSAPSFLDMAGTLGRLSDFLAAVEPERIGSAERGDLLHRWELCRTDAFRVCVHRFLRSDPDDFHDHPKDWGSLILAGGYWEVTPYGRTWRAPGSWVQRKAEELHRVEIDPEVGDAWTLFITGPSRREWGFKTQAGWQDWRSYVEASPGSLSNPQQGE